MHLNRSVVCPVIVGRADDLEVLQRLAAQSAQGAGQVAVIAGEAGIGKSRLIFEALKAAKPLGAQVLRGNCFENDRTVPYAPLLDLLRDFNASHRANDLSIYYGSTAPGLVKIIPELAAHMQVSPAPALEVEQEKRAIFQALSEFLFEGPGRKSVIVIEDLHWCDDISLEFLLYLARRSRTRSILLLLTYRNDEVTSVLEHFLAELDRGRLATELVLTRLSLPEVDTMLRAIFDLDRPVRPEFLDVLYPLTEGNPFFLEETLKSLVVAGEVFYADGVWDRKPIAELHVPRSIQDAVRRRIEHVSEDAKRTLGIGAAVGQRFDFSLLRTLTGLGEEDLLRAVKQLIAAQLITEESHERFAFRHALTREAIYSKLIERERRALHRQIAENLERLSMDGRDEQPASLAYHFYQAGIWDKAMDYSGRAAQQAQAFYAPRATIEHLTHAIEAGQQLGLGPVAALHRSRGSAHAILGDFESARADYEVALKAARSSRNGEQEWQILLDLGLLWAGRDYSETGRYYQGAYDLASATNDPQMRAHAHNRLGNWSVNTEHPVDGLEHHAQALQLFEELGDRRGLAETLDLLGMASYIRGDLVKSEDYYNRAVALFRDMNNRQALASSLASKMLNSSHLQSGMAVLVDSDRAQVVRGGEEALGIARAIGWRSGEAYALVMLADHFGIRGDYAKAFEFATMSLAVAEEIQHSQWITYSHYIFGALYLDILAAAEARRHLELALALANQIGSRWWVTNASGYLALTHILSGDLPRAADVLETALETSTEAIRGDKSQIRALTLGQRMCWYAAGELALAGGEANIALHIAEELLTSSANLSSGAVIPRLAGLHGRALLALNHFDEAGQALLGARAAAAREGEKPALWRTQAVLGSLYRLQGRSEQASEAFLEAQHLVADIAAAIPEAPLREGFSRRAMAVVPSARPLSARQMAKKESGGLTAREVEVARMISRGMSNREMADELTVGERTIETHVSNILAKLAFSSRTQVAAWAVERGLSGEAQS